MKQLIKIKDLIGETGCSNANYQIVSDETHSVLNSIDCRSHQPSLAPQQQVPFEPKVREGANNSTLIIWGSS